MGSQQGDDLQLNGDLACANAEIRGALRTGSAIIGGAAPLTSVAHDASLVGAGTIASPLSVAGPVVVGASPFFDDFIHGDATAAPWGWRITVSGGGATASLGNTEPTTVGTCQLDVNAAPDISAVTGTRDWFRLESFSSRAKHRVRANAAPTALADFVLEHGHVDNVGVPATTGVYFRCGFAATGNANWWAVANAGVPVVVDTGVLVDAAYHTFRIEFSMLTASWTFYVDDVLRATLPAQGQQNKGLGFVLAAVGATPMLAVADYFAFAAEVPR